MSFWKKNQWKKLTVLSLAAVFLAVNIKSLAEVAESRRLSILSVQGEEGFVIKGSQREVKAAGGMPLGQGSQVRTGMKTSMYLEADDDKVIKMDSSTLVEISKASSKKLKISLKSGEIFFNVEKPLAADEEMSFDAAQTSMSIRGTSGILDLDDDGLELFLIEGHVVWDIGNQIVEAEAGQKVSLKKVSGDALERNGMTSAYELWKTETFGWEDLDAMGLEAVLEQREYLDLSAIGLDSGEKLEDAQERSETLRAAQNQQEEAQRQKEEQYAPWGQSVSEAGGGVPGVIQRLDREPSGDSDSGSDEIELIINPTETEPVETAPSETDPEETKPSETKPSETDPTESDPVETKPTETDPAETKPEETKPEPFVPPDDADDGVNGEIFDLDDGTQTWFYYQEGRNGTWSGNSWMWYDSFLIENGLINTP